MNKLLIIILGVCSASMASVTEPNDHTKTTPGSAQKTHESAGNYRRGQSPTDYPSCTLEDKKWGEMGGTRLTAGLIQRTETGFVPASEGAEKGECTMLKVVDGVVTGLVEVRHPGDITRYTILPGALIGKMVGTYLYLPAKNPKEFGNLILAPCSLQDSPPQLALTRLSDFRAITEPIDSNEEGEKLEEDTEPLPMISARTRTT